MDILLLLISIIIVLIAQCYISATHGKYKKVLNKNQLSGFDVARKILDSNGLQDIYITETSGVLSDHYDPTRKVVKLSNEVYNNKTIASMAVAAHEVGHALQDKEEYSFLKFRTSLVPFVNFASYAGYFAIIIGAIFSLLDLIWLGIALELLILFFQIITLPVEFNASKRALDELNKLGLTVETENNKCHTMLNAAAFTYVASVLVTLLQILRLVLMANSRKR